jgi:hypothetical protein
MNHTTLILHLSDCFCRRHVRCYGPTSIVNPETKLEATVPALSASSALDVLTYKL